MTIQAPNVNNNLLFFDKIDELNKENIMASRTMQTRCRRRLKLKKAGRKRKNHNEKHGTTPKFAVHKEK
ncbi:MAG: hypothetical protein CME65_01145 [Halobacteriovoraceae bacterium]|nr:hypothetical protein [Halobacteriovoraceae bacterium]